MVVYIFSAPCYGTKFDLNWFDIANINCDSHKYADPTHGACYHAIFNATESSLVNVLCNGQRSCYYGDIWCPSYAEEVCNFECNGRYACYHADIFASMFLESNFTSLDCSSDYNSCSYAYIKCGKHNTRLNHNTNTDSFTCSNGYCCPYVDNEYMCDTNSDCVIDCTKS